MIFGRNFSRKRKERTRAVLERLLRADQWLFGATMIEEKLVPRWCAYVLLARLEDERLIVGKEDPISHRRAYNITDVGRAWLKENA